MHGIQHNVSVTFFTIHFMYIISKSCSLSSSNQRPFHTFKSLCVKMCFNPQWFVFYSNFHPIGGASMLFGHTQWPINPNHVVHSSFHTFLISLRCKRSLNHLASRFVLGLPWMHQGMPRSPCSCRRLLASTFSSTTL
jgi:hypothetical protein